MPHGKECNKSRDGKGWSQLSKLFLKVNSSNYNKYFDPSYNLLLGILQK